ncbi:MAG: hypothetical protein FWE34_02325 [Defluviitaleaceae bacterium]|nr:hypothetical protein [Defluviitaleaceae bacterium]
MDFVKEAERIINASSYKGVYHGNNALNTLPPRTSSRRGKTKIAPVSRTDRILNFMLFITGMAIVALLFLNFL